MRRTLVASALIVAGALPSALADGRSGEDAEQAKLAEQGLAIVKEKCARCHAITMDDKSAHAKAPPFRDVVMRYPSENLAEALAEGIVSGHPDMPVFVFQPEQIEGFIAYLDSLSPAADAAKPAPAPPQVPLPPGGGNSKP